VHWKRIALLLSVPAALACHTRVTPQGNEPFDFNTSAFASPAETVRLPARETRDIYQAVLRFYRPGPGRARWLDSVLLPSVPSGNNRITFPDLAASLVEELGASYCVLSERDCRGTRSGGTLRVSPVYQVDSQRVRVVVQFTSMDPYGPETSNSQVFLLARDAAGAWRIESRGPAKAGESGHTT
jgi:hypothetical protein